MTSNDSNTDILALENVSVEFGTLRVLQGIHLRVQKGEIHAIVGDRGAGKSTLVNVISGMIPRAGGTIVFDRKVLGKYTTKYAIKLGINTIYQEGSLLQNMTALENIFLHREIKKHLFFVDEKAMKARALAIFKELEIPLNPDIPIKSYNIAQQHLVELVKIACFPSKLLIIDQMSNKLLQKDNEKLYYILSMLRQGGTTILYVSGDMDEIFNFANRVTILNKGRIVETTEISNLDKIRLVQLTYSSMYSRERLEKSNLELFYLNNFNKSTLNNIPLPMLVTDSKDRVVIMNRMFQEINAIHHADFIGKPMQEILDPEDMRSKHADRTDRDQEGYRIQGVGLQHCSPPRYVDVYVLPFVDDDGSFMGTMYLLSTSGEQTEFTKHIRHHQPVMDFQKRLAGVAHEINNPLGIMLNYLRLIKTGKTSDQIRMNADIIEKEIKRIKRILKNMTDADEKVSSSIGITTIGDAIRDVALLLQPMMMNSHIYFEIDGDNEVDVTQEPDLVKQVVLNIMLNGIEAMPDGGELTVRLFYETQNRQTYVVIEIRDTGTGIPADKIEKIFEPFYTTKDTTESRGLGLSLCQDLLSRLQGSMSVESQEHYGTTFRVFLPHSE
ncbi:MAG: ATP-binding cassette domain-containing protein [bacterium]|nr:ATP-binding cassette domain-containing protein [bacterium]